MTSMAGKTVIVTGGNSGIGFATAEALASAGATTVVTARDEAKGTAAVRDIVARSGNPEVSLVTFDLGSLASVRQGAATLLERCGRIDVLINNAGLVLSDRHESLDGYEMTFAVNHLGPFLLTSLLLDRVTASAPARIVNVASSAHNQARKGMPFDDLQSTKRYRAMRVYGESKLANILFTKELARRLEGTGVTVNAVHPGTVATGYGRDGDTRGVFAFGLKIIKPFVLSPEKGARTSVYVASSPEVDGVTGQYFAKCRLTTPTKAAQDAAAATRLWDVSEELAARVPA
jgi:NAD(P)-dependent dehydrogenase (short-subunit alcohol dehydrogenase family)